MSAPAKAVPFYNPPDWGGRPAPGQPAISLDIIRQGVEVGALDLGGEMDHFTFGRIPDAVTYVLDTPTASRLHAVIQFKQADGTFYLYDVNSTHGTFVNREKVAPGQFVQLHVGDSIQFGQSSRVYVVNGPDELLPPETDGDETLEELRATRAERQATLEARIERRKQAKEARAKHQQQLLDRKGGNKDGGGQGGEEEEEESGISWGMGEDAVEEDDDEEENNEEEGEDGKKKKKAVELPDYLKDLPEHQRRMHESKLVGGGGDGGTGATTLDASEVHERDRKLYERLRARALKIENMQTEISRIYAKEGREGGLTDGQRAAVSRNEERIVALREEIESIEEQIRGKNAQREVSGSSATGRKENGAGSDEEGEGDDGDEFYDRSSTQVTRSTNWRARKAQKGGGAQHGKGGAVHGGGGGGAAASQIREVETLESLTAKAEACRKELATLREQVAAAPKDDGGGMDQMEEDSLEYYMALNARKGKQDALKAAERRVTEMQRELTRLEALIKIVRPAMPQLHARPSSSSVGAAPSPKHSPAMAPPPPHAPISPRTIDINAPQPLGPPLFDLDAAAPPPHPHAEPYLPHPPPHPPSSSSSSSSSPHKEEEEEEKEEVGVPPPKVVVVKGPAMVMPPPPPAPAAVKGPAARPPPAVSGTAAFLPSSQQQQQQQAAAQTKKRKEVQDDEEEEQQQGGGGDRRGKKKQQAGGNGGDAASEEAVNVKAKEDGAFVGLFVRPAGQRGDGRTSLNEKLGY